MMEIRRVCALFYSATGNTARTVHRISSAIAGQLQVPLESLDFTCPEDRSQPHLFPADTLVVAGTPVYAGKMPNKLLPHWKEKVKAQGAPAVGVVTFGGRSFDNGLAELCSLLEENGFHTIAAGAFVAPHVFSSILAADRPNQEDLALMDALAGSAADRVRSAPLSTPIHVPGDAGAPYYTPLGLDGKPAVFLKAKPKTRDTCGRCGLCAARCPMGAISREDPTQVPGTCIKCHACVKICPNKAKYFDDPAFLAHVSMLEENFVRPAESRIF